MQPGEKMKPWQLLDTAPLGTDRELRLLQRGDEFVIRLAGLDLMTSRVHGSEDALAALAMEALGPCAAPRVLVGGLGMGFTAAAALELVGPDGIVEVVELSPAVIRWNRGPLGHLANHPLKDRRLKLIEGDLARRIARKPGAYDAILNDVDNGPDGLLLPANRGLYTNAGLRSTLRALKPGGVLTIWSVAPDDVFTRRLRNVGFDARAKRVRDRGGDKGRNHTIWIARNAPYVSP
jgi:spermidine synthase